MIALALVLGGCVDLSNAAFTEDATYLAPLPSSERFGSPWADTPLPVDGDALVPAVAQEAGEELDATLAPLVAAGEALRQTPPDERTSVSRAWSDVLVASSGDQVELFHVRAEVDQTWEGLVEWTLDGRSGEGEWVQLATGRGHADGSGDLEWDLATTRRVVDTADGLKIAATWEGGVERRVRVSRDELRLEYPHEWLLVGSWFMLFTDSFVLDEEPLIGVAGVAHLPEAGGRARIEAYTDEKTVLVGGECWDTAGDQVWLGGDVPEPSGDEGLCAVEAFEW